jgi:pimeloyl-ACP methyl ester carboxylesterase
MARSGTHESTRKSEKIVRRIPPAKVCAAEHDPYRACARKTLTCVILAVAFTTGGSCWAGRSNHISPEVMNTHVIFSRVCSKVVYSSNRDGLVRPFLVEMKNPAEPKVSEIEIGESRNFIAQALAPDCRTLAMVSDHGGDGLFEIFLYDLQRSSLRKVTDTPGSDKGKPLFAPRGQLLAYLADGRLSLYDYVQARQSPVPEASRRFQTIIWSDDGASLFLEDERSDLWRYDVAGSRFYKLWTAPQPDLFVRTLSEHHDHLFFNSDHETDFRQIYDLDLHSDSLKRLYPTQHDEFSPEELNDGRYVLRTTVDSSFIALELINGKAQARSPTTGVVYDFSLAFGPPLLLYSNDHLPASLYWFEKGRLKPLVAIGPDARQPDAILIRNSSGAANFLYLPSPAPRGLLIWLHGGPHEQVSPRFNLFFDFFARKNLAVYAINYPGSTGFGKAYAMYARSQEEVIPIQVQSIERDISQLRRLRPALRPFVLVGVSYGSVLAHLVAAAHPEFSRLIDFSGVASQSTMPDPGARPQTYPSALFIYGADDAFSGTSDRTALLARYDSHAKGSRLVLPQEGHYIERRDSIDRILKSLDEFLETPVHR